MHLVGFIYLNEVCKFGPPVQKDHHLLLKASMTLKRW